MDITVHYNRLPIAPRKLRAFLAYLKRGDRVPQAVAQLRALGSPNTEPLRKLLLASVSAVRDRQAAAQPDDVVIKEFYCNEGARLYRTRIKGRGRSSRFAKRGSHLTLTVSVAPKRPAVKPSTRRASRTAASKGAKTTASSTKQAKKAVK